MIQSGDLLIMKNTTKMFETAEGFIYEVAIGGFTTYFIGDQNGMPKKSCTPATWKQEVVGRVVTNLNEGEVCQNAINAGKAIAYCLRKDRSVLPAVFSGLLDEVLEVANLCTKSHFAGKNASEAQAFIEKMQADLQRAQSNLEKLQAEKSETDALMQSAISKLRSKMQNRKHATEKLADHLDPQTADKLRMFGQENPESPEPQTPVAKRKTSNGKKPAAQPAA